MARKTLRAPCVRLRGICRDLAFDTRLRMVFFAMTLHSVPYAIRPGRCVFQASGPPV